MIGAHQTWRAARAVRQNLCPPVSAAIVKSNHRALGVTDDQYGRAPDRDRNVRAWLSELRLEADHGPVTVENSIEVKLIDVLRRIEGLRQCMARTPLP